jgi:hypothetical protein
METKKSIINSAMQTAHPVIGFNCSGLRHHLLSSVEMFSPLSFAMAAIVEILCLFTTSSSATTVYWTQWNSETLSSAPSTPGSALGTISPLDINVYYSGEVIVGWENTSWLPTTTFSGGTISNPPTITNRQPPPPFGYIGLEGGSNFTGVDTISFSAPVVDPVMAIWSLGDPTTKASFVFPTAEPVTIESGGPSQEWGGQSITLTQSGNTNTINGMEGNGTIQFQGTFTQISWTCPLEEYYYVFTVGVPEPATLFLLGLGASVLFGRRRR